MNESDCPTHDQPDRNRTSDAELLQQFARTDDGDAFRELVVRHEKLVLGVCRRVLWNEHDAEDAFQATFMILARKSRKLRCRRDISGWLYAVAYRTAIRARSRQQIRQTQPLDAEIAVAGNALAELARRDELRRLDEELNALPQKYRDPLVLHYLLGKSQKEVARDLALSVRAVEGRLRRGKRELRYRLAKRGLAISSVAAIAHVSPQAVQACPASPLLEATVQSALHYASGKTGGPNTAVAHELARKELSRMSRSSLSVPATIATMAIAALTLGGAGQFAHHTSAAAQASESLLELGPEQPAPPQDEPVAFSTRQPLVAALEDATATPTSDDATRDGTRAATGRGVIDFKGVDAGELRIRQALQKPTEIDFRSTPLAEVVDSLATLSGVRIFVDPSGLAEEAVRKDTPIDFQSQGIPLKDTLRLVLDPLHLDYIITDDYLLITSERRAEAEMETRVYATRDLAELTPETLTKVIEGTIRPGTWRNATLDAAIEPFAGGLVITHNQQVHAEIADLLRQLQRHAAARKEQ